MRKNAPIETHGNHSGPSVSSVQTSRQLGLFPAWGEVRRHIEPRSPKWVKCGADFLGSCLIRRKTRPAKGEEF